MCNGDCGQGRNCNCVPQEYYDSWAREVWAYIILMIMSGVIGFVLGYSPC